MVQDNSMRAKCPRCTDGCDECEGGYRTVRMARGHLYTRHCTSPSCGFDNGGKIDQRELDGESCGQCIRCRAPAVYALMAKEGEW